jgi:putative aldouronate transport system substrate-binding protein
MTRANKYPDVTMRWVDRLYEPVMSAQVSWGPIGTTLEENADGVLQQAELPDRVSAGELRQKVAPGGVSVTLREDFENVILPEPRALQRVNDLDAAVAAVEQAAIQASCETRRLVGQQAAAFTAAALPLCRSV